MTGEYDADLLWRHNTIEEKMNIASQLLQVELAVIEPLGDVRYKTDALSESVLSSTFRKTSRFLRLVSGSLSMSIRCATA